MTNYSAKILNNAISSIGAQQAVIATTSNNIANVNTEGYARRSVNLETRSSRTNGGSINVGNGVQVSSITRQVDQYLEAEWRGTVSEMSSADVMNDYMKRIDALFSLTQDHDTIGSTLNSFFVAAQDLAAAPADIELRSSFIERAQDLVNSIKSTYSSLADLQKEADSRLTFEVDSVNTITTQIADLNKRIVASEGGGNQAVDERDKRDTLLKDLAEKIGFDAVELNDGSVNVVLENGFTIVSGTTTRQLSLSSSPSFAAGSLPESLGGGVLRYIVYDYSQGAGTAEVDFTKALQGGGGTIGGLLKMRGYVDPSLTDPSAFQANGNIVEVASRVEAITQQLLTAVNQEYLGPDRSGTAGYQPSSGDLNGQVPDVYGLFDFEFGSGVKDVDGDGFPDDIGNHDLGNYSSRLKLAITTPQEVAAARDSTPSALSPTFLPGDNRNITAIADLQSEQFGTSNSTYNQFAVGSFTLQGTFGEAYANTITTVSIQRTRADGSLSLAQAKNTAAENQRDEISSVSLDEEFSSLIRFQKAFEASARLIRTGQELLDEILNLV